MGTILFTLLLASHPASGACPLRPEALDSALDTSMQAYDDWAWEDFEGNSATLFAELSCLDAPVTAAQAERIHLLLALRAAQAKDDSGTREALEAVLRLAPTYEPSQALAPLGSLLRGAFQAAQQVQSGEPLPLPPGEWFLDGEGEATDLPIGSAALLQRRDATGLLSSWYLVAGPLPADLEILLSPEASEVAAPVPAVVAEEQAIPLPTEPTSAQHPMKTRRPSRTLLVAGLATGAVAAGGLVWSSSMGRQLDQTEADWEATDPYADAETLYHRGLAVTLGSHALGITAGGLVVGAVIRGRW